MPVLNTLIIEVVTEDELTERRLNDIAAETSEYIHVVLTEPDDSVIVVNDVRSTAHIHDGTSRCAFCEHNAYNSRNGDIVVANG